MNIYKNSRGFVLRFLFLAVVILAGQPAVAQVFPQTNKDPEKTAQDAKSQENEKLGLQFYRNQEYGKSLEIFKKLYEEKPSSLNYAYYLNSLIALQEYENAEKLIRKHSRNSNDPKHAVDLGYVLMEAGNTDKADKLLNQLIDDMPASRNSVIVLANAFNGRRFYDYAVKTYLRGRQILSESYAFHDELARMYEITGDYESMLMEYLALLEYEPEMIGMVQNRLQNVLSRDTDGSLSQSFYEALLRKNQENPDNLYISEMLLWHSIQEKNFRFAMVQAISLDKRLGEDGNRVFSIAGISMSNRDYDIAMEGFEYLILKGPGYPYYVPSRTGFLRSRFLDMTESPLYDRGALATLEREYASIIGELGPIPESIQLRRDQARILAFYLDDTESAVTNLSYAINLPGARPQDVAGCKIDLADVYLFQGEVWEATLLYSQVEKAFKNDPVGQEAKFKNAKLSFYIGEFGWAKAQLDVLKAATSKFIANDAMELSLLISDNLDADSSNTGLKYYATAQLLTYRNYDSLALAYLDSIFLVGFGHPLNDEVLLAKANIYIKQKKYPDADSLLGRVTGMYPGDILADNALLMRGRLHEEVFRDPERAMELYQQLLIEYPGSLQATEARRRFRALRGDNPDS